MLLVVGDKDMYLAVGEAEQAARLIPSCTLRIYPNTNHFGAITGQEFAADALELIPQHQPAPPTNS